ncbi:MAG: LamG-like jellyroll fold domain-containing protein [Verrucomicrobiales bacterium]
MTDEFDRLTQAYIDGTIAEGDSARLNAILRADPNARREFAERLNLDSMISALAAGGVPDRIEPRPRPARRLALVGARWLAAAACLALLLGGALWWQNASRAFATVAASVGADALPAGMELRGGDFQLQAGTVEMVSANGARLVIEAPAEFRFESAQRLHMKRGRLSADVPPAAKGFTVITPSGNAVDLGTRFGIDVPDSGAAEVHVFEGEVIAKASGETTERSLLAGDAVKMADGASSARDLWSAAFIQPDEMREFGKAVSERRARSEAALAELRGDPAIIALLDFESGDGFPGAYRLVQGRWPGSRAPEFINNGDHIKLDVGGDGEWDQLTLAAWVRLDHLGAPFQSLLHADGWDGGKFGKVHWMVNQAATMRFAMWGNKPLEGTPEGRFYPDSRTPVLSDKGRWVHLAAVYDAAARTVRFYRDGRFDNEVPQAVAFPARFGPAQIGNWNREDRKLSGRVDELIILGRTMVDAEVRDLYEAGNPYF